MLDVEHTVLSILFSYLVGFAWEICKKIYNYSLKYPLFASLVCLYTKHQFTMFEDKHIKHVDDVLNHDHFKCKRCNNRIKSLKGYAVDLVKIR